MKIAAVNKINEFAANKKNNKSIITKKYIICIIHPAKRLATVLFRMYFCIFFMSL